MTTLLCLEDVEDPARTYCAGSTYVCSFRECLALEKKYPHAFEIVAREGMTRRDKAIHFSPKVG